jgi:uncharacterized protein (DUF1501 family)
MSAPAPEAFAMLSFVDPSTSRRDFLRIGGLALGGLSLSDLLAAQAVAADERSILTGKSVIFLFLHGGPPQTEMFDPKMDAPAEIRSAVGEIETSLPGVTFGSTLEKLAPLAKKLSIVRSFTTGDGNHDIKPIVGKDTGGANVGSLYARIAGANHPTSGMPRNVALFPRAVAPETQPAVTQFGRFDSAGQLGTAFAPFIPGGEGAFQQNLKLNIARERLDDRRNLLTNLDRLRRHLDRSAAWASMDRMQAQAMDTILGGVADAFDLGKEDPRVIERYDTAKLVPRERISKRWNNHKNYADHGQTLGKLLLLARRLCEGGAGFVTVTTNFVWDMHADDNNATVEEGMEYCAKPFDHAVSAFIEDCAARGLSDKILLVCCGEMGRTPRINKKGGRDHWGGLAPLLLTGGGLGMGQVVGQSSRDAGEPASEPITGRHLLATIMHTLLDVPQLRLVTGLPPDVTRLATGSEPIKELL